jgi:hypothetical protein
MGQALHTGLWTNTHGNSISASMPRKEGAQLYATSYCQWLRFVHSHYPHQWTHKVLTRHQLEAPAATDSNAKWLDWFTATDDQHQVLQSTTGTSRALRLTSWSNSRTVASG